MPEFQLLPSPPMSFEAKLKPVHVVRKEGKRAPFLRVTWRIVGTPFHVIDSFSFVPQAHWKVKLILDVWWPRGRPEGFRSNQLDDREVEELFNMAVEAGKCANGRVGSAVFDAGHYDRHSWRVDHYMPPTPRRVKINVGNG